MMIVISKSDQGNTKGIWFLVNHTQHTYVIVFTHIVFYSSL